MTIFYGSKSKIDKYIELQKSEILNDEKVIHGSYYYEIILTFLGKKWTNRDIEVGSYKFKTYIIEKRPGAFEDIFRGQKGYIYEITDKGFKKDSRLHENQFELIKKTRTKIKVTHEINDVLKELRKSDAVMINYDSLNFVYFIGSKKKLKSYKNELKYENFNYNDLVNLPNGNVLIKANNIDFENIEKNINVDKIKKTHVVGFSEPLKNYRVYTLF